MFWFLEEVSKQIVSSKQMTVTDNAATRIRYSRYLKKCEKINLSTHKWMALPDMKEGRRSFNPCEFNGGVYVCGSGSLLVELF